MGIGPADTDVCLAVYFLAGFFLWHCRGLRVCKSGELSHPGHPVGAGMGKYLWGGSLPPVPPL